MAFRRCTPFHGKHRSGARRITFEFGKTVWNDTLKATDKFVEKHLSNEILGFGARVLVASGVFVAGLSGIAWSFARFEERKPIAKRWFPKWTPITLIEKVPMEPGSDTYIFRFALPHTYDTVGYSPVSSVLLQTERPPGWYKGKKRWYTPISHPDQRGVIEFAIKLKEPGYMSQELRHMKRGGRMWIGPWVKEFRHRPNVHDTLECIAGGTGVTPFLQLLNVITQNPEDKTKVRLLYTGMSPTAMPFFKRLLDMESQYPDHLEVKFLADHGRWDKHPDANYANKGWTGSVSPDFISRWIGGPTYIKPADVNSPINPANLPKPGERREMKGEEKERRVLVSGPGPFMTYICGRATMIPFYNKYHQGPYHGILKQLGFRKGQVYQFGSPWSISTQT